MARFYRLTVISGTVIVRSRRGENLRGQPNQRLRAVAHFRRWTGATPPEVFFYPHPMPPSSPNSSLHSSLRSQFVAFVQSNKLICREHYRLVLRLDEFPTTEPGQFVQLQCRDGDRDYEPDREWSWPPEARLDVAGDEIAGALALLRRPFSLAGRRDTSGGVELEIIHRVVGVGTDWLS